MRMTVSPTIKQCLVESGCAQLMLYEDDTSLGLNVSYGPNAPDKVAIVVLRACFPGINVDHNPEWKKIAIE